MRRFAPLIVFAAWLVVPASASALTVSKAELSGGQLRIEGSGALGSYVSATSTAGAAAGARTNSGAFKIETSGFVAPNCTVIVSDGRTPIAEPRLSGCTPQAASPSTDPAPPSGSCVIDATAALTVNAGDGGTLWYSTTGCQGGPLQWKLVAGSLPPGMDQPTFAGQIGGMISGRAITEGTYTFTVQVTDATGNTDQERSTITVLAPRPVSITSPATLQDALLNRSYQVILTADGGLPGYTWTLVGGTLPPGVGLFTNSVAGTPTARGTYTFTVQATDSRGSTGRQTFTLTVD